MGFQSEQVLRYACDLCGTVQQAVWSREVPDSKNCWAVRPSGLEAQNGWTTPWRVDRKYALILADDSGWLFFPEQQPAPPAEGSGE